MNVSGSSEGRRFLAETAALVLSAVVLAAVSNALASRERHLAPTGRYPALSLPSRIPDLPQVATGTPTGSTNGRPPVAATSPAAAPRQGSVPPANKAAPSKVVRSDLLRRFPPHPEVPWTEVSGEDVSWLHGQGVLFLDARRTKAFEEEHVAGALSFPVWESDVDARVLGLVNEARTADLPFVLYCSGGDCEDSHLLAERLWSAGFTNLLVYKGGFPDWKRRGGPVSKGPRP